MKINGSEVDKKSPLSGPELLVGVWVFSCRYEYLAPCGSERVKTTHHHSIVECPVKENIHTNICVSQQCQASFLFFFSIAAAAAMMSLQKQQDLSSGILDVMAHKYLEIKVVTVGRKHERVGQDFGEWHMLTYK